MSNKICHAYLARRLSKTDVNSRCLLPWLLLPPAYSSSVSCSHRSRTRQGKSQIESNMYLQILEKHLLLIAGRIMCSSMYHIESVWTSIHGKECKSRGSRHITSSLCSSASLSSISCMSSSAIASRDLFLPPASSPIPPSLPTPRTRGKFCEGTGLNCDPCPRLTHPCTISISPRTPQARTCIISSDSAFAAHDRSRPPSPAESPPCEENEGQILRIAWQQKNT